MITNRQASVRDGREHFGLAHVEDDVGAADLSGGGDVLPALKVKSVFVRENDGRLSGDVRRDTSRDSGRTGIRLLPMEVRFVRYLGAMLAA